MFSITKDRTPVLFQQPAAVQQAAKDFNTDYNSKNSVKVRRAWGAFFEQIQKGLTQAKNAKGETMDGVSTFTAICKELDVPRSSAYAYIRTHISCSNYPQAIQDAAEDAGLNLAQDHVIAEYVNLKGKNEAGVNPAQPTILEARGIVALLADAPNPNKKPPVSHKTGAARFHELLNEAFEYADEEELEGVDVGNVVAVVIADNITGSDAITALQGMFQTTNGWTLVTDASGKVVGATAPVL